MNDLDAIATVEAWGTAEQPQVYPMVNFARMSLKELKEYADTQGIDRDRIREYGKLSARNTWEEGLIAITSA